LVVTLSVAVPPSANGSGWIHQPTPGWTWSAFISSLGVPPAWAFDPPPPIPVQQGGTAAGKSHTVPTSATRSGSGVGHAPGVGKGQLPLFQRASRPVAAGLSATIKGVFDPKTSKRDVKRSTARTTWFSNADGSITRNAYAGVVNYQAGDGTFQSIDASLVAQAGGGFAELANGIGVGVGARADALAVGSVSLDAGHSAGYSLAGAAPVVPSVSGDTATYPSVFPGTDLRLTTLSQGFETEFVLTSRAAPRVFTMPMQLVGLSAKLTSTGGVDLVDSTGAVRLHVSAGSMMDSKIRPGIGGGAESRGVTYALTTVDGQPALQVTLDSAWLDDPARVYPVVVDPDTFQESGDTFASQANPGDNSGSTHLKVGTPDPNGPTTNTARSFLQFGSLSNTGEHVTGVKLNIADSYAFHCSDPEPFTVYGITNSWTPSGVTSYPGPSLTSSNYGSISVQANSNICANGTNWDPSVYQWMSGDLNSTAVAAVQSWALGGSNFGMAITAADNNDLAWKVFNSNNTSTVPYLTITETPDVAPTTTAMYPPPGYSAPTLTPELTATATDDGWPSTTLKYTFTVHDQSTGAVVDASPSRITTADYRVNPGKLVWGKSYYWDVDVYDGFLDSKLIESTFTTTVPQPLVTSGLSANEGHGFSPTTANYTTQMTDAQVSTIGPQLQIDRNYNSRDPRLSEAFGAGWSSVLDAHVTPTTNTLIITYPNGSENAWGLNADGTYSSPSGRFATLSPTTSPNPAGFTFVDKDDTTYTFEQPLAVGYGITSIKDANQRSETFGYNANNQIITMTSASGRALHLTWTTPSGGASAHVWTVATDPVTAGGSNPLTWTYTYTGDQLTKVCTPVSTTACHQYSYQNGSLYATSTLDAGPQQYWPLADPANSAQISNAVLAAVNGTALPNNMTFGSPGGLPGSTATSASFNGSTSYMGLPKNIETGLTYQSVSMWFKATAANGVLFGYETDPVTNASTTAGFTPVLYVGGDGKLNAELWQGGFTPIVSSNSVVDGNWHHVVLTGTGNTQDLYLDGGHVGALSGQIAISAAAVNNTIGSGFVGGAWPDNSHHSTTDPTGFRTPFTGNVSDVAIYDRPLSGVEVGQLYSAGSHAANLLTQVTRPSTKVYAHVTYDYATGLVTDVTDENGGHWGIGRPSASGSSQIYLASVLGDRPEDLWRLNDPAGAANAVNVVKGPLATYNAVTLGSSGHFADTAAASFNGTSSYVRLPDNLVSGAQNAINSTVSMWFNTTTPNGVLFSYQGQAIGGTVTSYVPALYVGSDGKLLGTFWNAPQIVSAKTVTDGNWHQVVLETATAASGADVNLYLDGSLVGTSNGTVNSPQAPSAPLPFVYVGAGSIGGSWPDESKSGQSAGPLYFNGKIADVAYFTSSLKLADVQAQNNAAVASTAATATPPAGAAPVETVVVTDPAGHPSTYTYDLTSGLRPLSTVDAMNRLTQYGYDTGGFQATVTDPNGIVTTSGHDVRGNVITTTTCQDQTNNKCATVYYTYYPDDSSTTLSPNPTNDLLHTMRDGRSSDQNDTRYLTTYTYDAAGNRTTVTSPPVPGITGGRLTRIDYTDGTTIASANNNGTFAPAELPYRQTTPGGAVTLSTYFQNGDVATTTSADGAVTSYAYDNLGRVTTRTATFNSKQDGSGTSTTETTSFQYNGLGMVTSQTDPAVMDRITGAVHTPVTSTTYDDDGDVSTSTITDSTGGDPSRTISFTYDGFDRAATQTDAAGNALSFTYDGFGNVLSRTRASGTEIDLGYNLDSQLTSTTLKNYTGDPVNPSAPGPLVTESRAYDPAGRLASVTDSMANKTSYTYTDDGLTASVTVTDSTGTKSFVEESDTYDGAGNLLTKTTNNGATLTDYGTPDGAGRPSTITVDHAGVNRVTTYTYTPDDGIATTSSSDANGSVQTANTYDLMGHLTSRTVSDSTHGGPTARWDLTESGGTTARDSSGDGHGLVATGGVTLGGGAATLDGTGYLATTGTSVNTSQSFSVSAWVNLSSLPTANRTVVAQDGSKDSAFYLQYNYAYANQPDWNFVLPRTDVNGASFANTAVSGAATGWTHLAGVYDSVAHTAKLYVNGALANTSNNVTAFQGNGPTTIGRGLFNGSQTDKLTGSIAGVQIYQQALSATQISSLYSGGHTAASIVTGQLTSSYTLDQLGNVTAATDGDGNTTIYSFDELGRPTQTQMPAVNVESNGGAPVQAFPLTKIGYDSFGDRVETSDADGNVTTYGYDQDGRLSTTTLASYTAPGSSTATVATTTRTYLPDGQVHTVTDPLGNITTYAYDQLGDVATITNPDTSVIHNTYDTNQEQLSTTDGTGAQKAKTYDYLGRVSTSTDVVRQPSPLSDTTTYQYAPAGWLSSVTTQNGAVTSYGYDNVGDQTSVVDGANNHTTHGYDVLGRRTSTTNPDGSSDSVTYDQAGYQTGTTVYDTNHTPVSTTSTTYDNDGNALAITNGLGHTTTFTYDPTGAITSEVQPVTSTHSITTSFGYDGAGNRTRFTDGRGNSFISTFNSWGLPESQIEPSTSTYTAPADSTFTNAYDADGRLATMTSPGGVRVTYGYNALGETTSESGTGADAATDNRSFDYYSNGLLKSATSGAGQDTFTYDDRGALLGATGPSGTSSFAYNRDGLMTSRTDAAGTTNYTYDGADRLSTVADPLNAITASYQYNTLDQVSKITYGTGGDTRTLGYDNQHRPQTDVLATSGGTQISSVTYGWDNDSNLVSKTTSGLAYAEGQANTYTYDQADRLTSWNDSVGVGTYGYDDSGNRTQVNGNTYTYDPRDELTSANGATFTYTARGTLSSSTSGSTTFTSTYDAYGQDITSALQSYTYDALGRTLTSTWSTPFSFAYSGMSNTVASDGSATYSYDPSGGVIGARSSGTSVLQWADAHTDVIANFSPTGTTLTGTVEYDPFGAVIAGGFMRGNLGYQSGWTDPFTNHVNMASRWYSPLAGQFQSRDSVSPGPVPNSAAANPFAYLNDNPLAGTDPSGHCGDWWNPVCDIEAAGNAVVNTVKDVASTVYDDVISPVVNFDWGAEMAGLADIGAAVTAQLDKLGTFATHVATSVYHGAVNTYHAAAKVYHQAANLTRSVVHYATHPAQLYAKVKDGARKVAHAAMSAGRAAVHYAHTHAAEIVATVASTLVYAGCEAALGVATAGAGAVLGSAACGAAAGAVNGAIEQAGKCFGGQQGACSLKSFGTSIGMGAIDGAISYGIAGPLGGKVAGMFKGATSLLSRTAVGALDGAFTGSVDGALTGATNYGLTCGSDCSWSGLGQATTSGAVTGAIGGAAGGAIGGATSRPGKEPSGGGCPIARQSFTASTPVLMADGSTKPIKDIKVGDKVTATDPLTGKTSTEPVAASMTHTDTDLTDLKVADSQGKTAVLHTTQYHPFWDDTQHAWVFAGNLPIGDDLHSASGTTVHVVEVDNFTASNTMLDLTITDVHTFYVLAGTTPVLVHNCPGGLGGSSPSKADLKKFPDVSHLRGAEPDDVLNVIPDHWKVDTPSSVSPGGEGVRFSNPNAPSQSIIYESGWPGSTDPLHGGPYLRVADGTQPSYRIPLAGNPQLMIDEMSDQGLL
jgi:RHS repeat-associated protein